jgi:hypothetical protein
MGGILKRSPVRAIIASSQPAGLGFPDLASAPGLRDGWELGYHLAPLFHTIPPTALVAADQVFRNENVQRQAGKRQARLVRG